jgi:hypothetical protein
MSVLRTMHKYRKHVKEAVVELLKLEEESLHCHSAYQKHI